MESSATGSALKAFPPSVEGREARPVGQTDSFPPVWQPDTPGELHPHLQCQQGVYSSGDLLQDPVWHRIVIEAGQGSGANSFLDIDGPDLVRQKEPMEDQSPSTQSYGALLASIKERIQSAQVRAALAVNRELVLLYWGIGKEILARQEQEGWGTKVIERLAKELRSEFPMMKGFSKTNLLYMRAFF